MRVNCPKCGKRGNQSDSLSIGAAIRRQAIECNSDQCCNRSLDGLSEIQSPRLSFVDKAFRGWVPAALLSIMTASCGPLGKQIGVDIATCAADTTVAAAGQIVSHLDSNESDWKDYLASTVAITGGINFLRCGVSHLIRDLTTPIASRRWHYLHKCHAVKESHRERLTKTALQIGLQ